MDEIGKIRRKKGKRRVCACLPLRCDTTDDDDDDAAFCVNISTLLSSVSIYFLREQRLTWRYTIKKQKSRSGR